MSTANLPNEPGAWDSDFSYAYLERLYGALRARFVPTLLGDTTDVLKADGSKRVFVRHDIDVSLDRARPMAQQERAWGFVTTYHVMLDSPFYDIRSSSSCDAIAEIGSLGHEIGLHYDVDARGTRDVDTKTREADIAKACEELEAITGKPVRSLSFHLPVSELINGPTTVAGRVSGYAKELFQWYLSDSRARFREGEPLGSFERPKGPHLQLLLHPIWWGPEHAHPTLRLRDFLLEVGPRLGRTYEDLNDVLWKHIIYRAVDAP